MDTAGCTQCYIPPGVGVVEVGWGWLGLIGEYEEKE